MKEILKLIESSIFQFNSKSIFLEKFWQKEIFVSKLLVEISSLNKEYDEWLDFGPLDKENVKLINENKSINLKWLEEPFQNKDQISLECKSILNPELVKKQAIERGYSIKVYNHDQQIRIFRKFSLSFGEIFDSKISLNSYFTPKNSKCYTPHRDLYDIFIVQIRGQKDWRVQSSLGYAEDMSLSELKQINLKEKETDRIFTLKEGDLLYLPSGISHSASTDQDHDSLHLTIGLHQKTLKDELIKLTTSKYLNENGSLNSRKLILEDGKLKSQITKKQMLDLILLLKDQLNKT